MNLHPPLRVLLFALVALGCASACGPNPPSSADAGTDASFPTGGGDGGGGGSGGDAGSDAGLDAGDLDAGSDAGTMTAEVCDGIDNDGDGLVDEGPNGEVLTCATGCAALFDQPQFAESFDDPTAYSQRWSESYVKPTLASGDLVIGPHAMSSNWWETYTWVTTSSGFGDALACARWRFTPNGSTTRANSLDFVVRASGDYLVALNFGAAANAVTLSTRLSAQNNQWIQHGSVPFTFTSGAEMTIDAIVYAKGNRFHAELKNVDTGEIASFTTDSPMVPTTGSVGFVGWQLDSPLKVSAVTVGAPRAAVGAVLDAAKP